MPSNCSPDRERRKLPLLVFQPHVRTAQRDPPRTSPGGPWPHGAARVHIVVKSDQVSMALWNGGRRNGLWSGFGCCHRLQQPARTTKRLFRRVGGTWGVFSSSNSSADIFGTVETRKSSVHYRVVVRLRGNNSQVFRLRTTRRAASCGCLEVLRTE